MRPNPRTLATRFRFGRHLAVAAAAAGAAVALCVPSAGATTHEPHMMKLKGGPHASTSGNLIDHGGKVLAASSTYAIFWGPQSAWASDVPSGIATLLGGFNGSNYLGIGTQYMRGSAISSSYKGTTFDSSAPPRKVSASTLGNEVQKLFGTNLDTNAVYIVYTSNFPNGGNFCAWHNATTVSGTTIQVAYMPNTGLVGASCDPGNPYGLSGSEDLRSLANVTAHEFMEAITDAQLNAWYDSSGSEIGDKCAWQFTGPVTLSNRSVWQLQEEWSNAASGCVQGA
jgi:hypothetical protein